MRRRVSRGLVGAVLAALTLFVLGVIPTSGAPDGQDGPEQLRHTPASRSSPCAFWYAIGEKPTPAEIAAAAAQDAVVVLNSWETDALHQLKKLNPRITVLVYKDLSSTRSYETQDLGQGNRSAAGLAYAATDRDHPEWFATDSRGSRISWDPYPGHWQMTVWNPGYQRAWADAVTREVVDDGWDGVLADNDFASLRFYSSATINGTSGQGSTDQLIRDGLDTMVGLAGRQIQTAGKIFVPNVSEARLYPGRWAQHSRFGGAMEENFAYFQSGDQYVSGDDWLDQTQQVTDPHLLSLSITRAAPSDRQAQRYGFASVAVRGQGHACWMLSTTDDYSAPARSAEQDIPLGAPDGPGESTGNGLWTRSFQAAWIAVNPTARNLSTVPPAGFRSAAGHAVGPITVPANDAVVLRR